MSAVEVIEHFQPPSGRHFEYCPQPIRSSVCRRAVQVAIPALCHDARQTRIEWSTIRGAKIIEDRELLSLHTWSYGENKDNSHQSQKTGFFGVHWNFPLLGGIN